MHNLMGFCSLPPDSHMIMKKHLQPYLCVAANLPVCQLQTTPIAVCLTKNCRYFSVININQKLSLGLTIEWFNMPKSTTLAAGIFMYLC